MATPVESALRRAVADLNALKIRWALVGGLAVSVRAVPRFTKDLDFAVAVAGDDEAEDVVHRLGGRGYRPVELLEQEYVKRMSGVRLEVGGSDVVVDLLFASSGIESEVVAAAARLEVLPQLTAPVARARRRSRPRQTDSRDARLAQHSHHGEECTQPREA